MLKDFDGGNAKNDVRLKLAGCYIKMNNTAQAKAMCEDIIKDSKEGYWFNMAKGIMAEIK